MKIFTNKIARNTLRAILYTCAAVGVIFIAVFFAVRLGLLNVKGSISDRNAYFNFNRIPQVENDTDNLHILCEINVLGKYAPLTSINIYKTMSRGVSSELIDQMIQTASRRFQNDPSYEKNMKTCEDPGSDIYSIPMTAYAWADIDQWALMKEVFTRDQEIINKAAKDAHVSPRIILAGVIGEQFRFFNNRRESFKSYFEPMKLLASLSNTSFGIAGLKPKTIGQIEEHLKDRKSPFYLGLEMENIVNHDPSIDIEEDRLNRITDTKNPYYSYLYVGLFMKQIQAQWARAGYDISNRPDVLATLYNLGFYRSVPKSDPAAGGAIINVNGVDYTFGDLGYEFYYSGELSNIFPLEVQ